MKKFYVYILRRTDLPDPFYIWKGQPFYIGKGSNGRISHHRKEANFLQNKPGRKNLKINIILKLWQNGLDFQEEIILKELAEIEAFNLEKKLIAKYGRINQETGCLTNVTDGGEGPTGLIRTEEHLQKIKANRVPPSGPKHWLYGKKIPEEIKQKMRDNAPDRTGEKNPNYGKKMTKENREKIAEANRKRIFTKEKRQEISNRNRGTKNPFYGKSHNKETIEKLRHSKKLTGINHPLYGTHCSLETKEKIKTTWKYKRWDKLIKQVINEVI